MGKYIFPCMGEGHTLYW